MPTKESKPLSDRQLRFIDLVAAGKPIGVAYVEAGYSSTSRASTDGCKLLKNPAVKARLEELREGNAARAAISRDQIIGWLTEAILTPAGVVDESHPGCQEVTRYYRGEEISRMTTKMVNKLQALKILVAMMGWTVPKGDGFDLAKEWKEMLESWKQHPPPPDRLEDAPQFRTAPEDPEPPAQAPNPSGPIAPIGPISPESTPPAPPPKFPSRPPDAPSLGSPERRVVNHGPVHDGYDDHPPPPRAIARYRETPPSSPPDG